MFGCILRTVPYSPPDVGCSHTVGSGAASHSGTALSNLSRRTPKELAQELLNAASSGGSRSSKSGVSAASPSSGGSRSSKSGATHGAGGGGGGESSGSGGGCGGGCSAASTCSAGVAERVSAAHGLSPRRDSSRLLVDSDSPSARRSTASRRSAASRRASRSSRSAWSRSSLRRTRQAPPSPDGTPLLPQPSFGRCAHPSIRLLSLPTEPVRARRQAGRQGGGQGGGDRRARAAFLFRVGAVSGGRGGGRGGGRRCGGRVEAAGGNVGEAAGGDSEACCGRSERRVCAVVGGWRRRGRGRRTSCLGSAALNEGIRCSLMSSGEGCGGRGGGRSGHRPRDLMGKARQPGLSPPVRQPGLSPPVRGAVAPRVASADAGVRSRREQQAAGPRLLTSAPLSPA